MSTLQVANIQFETTGTNRIDFPIGGNTIFVRAENVNLGTNTIAPGSFNAGQILVGTEGAANTTILGANITTGNIAATGNISAQSLTVTGNIAATGNISAQSLTVTGNIAATGDISAQSYQKNGVNGKLLVKSQYTSNGTNFSTTGATNVVLSSIITYVPESSSSQVFVTITAYVSMDQTGSDNDALATLYAYSFESNGTTRISPIGIDDSVTDNNVGFVDGTDGERADHCITIQGECVRASDGNIYVRLWGSRTEDATAGYAATFTMKICNFVFMEFL